jgi:SAM-dependent methyltransferase
LPALCAWLLAWAAYRGLTELALPMALAVAVACLAGGLCARGVATPWRRLCVAAGFPLSWLLTWQLHAQGAVDAAWWLLPLALLCSLYPVHAWRDAPLFPTPASALGGLAAQAPLLAGARVVDAGCGLGDGLLALAGVYPQARLHGWEWSRPLAWACAWRCRAADVRRADIWRQDWSAFDLVYLFQRPESMPRAVEKARAELRPGAYLVSLEFEAPGWRPLARLETVPGKPVWIYRVPLKR